MRSDGWRMAQRALLAIVIVLGLADICLNWYSAEIGRAFRVGMAVAHGMAMVAAICVCRAEIKRNDPEENDEASVKRMLEAARLQNWTLIAAALLKLVSEIIEAILG